MGVVWEGVEQRDLFTVTKYIWKQCIYGILTVYEKNPSMHHTLDYFMT